METLAGAIVMLATATAVPLPVADGAVCVANGRTFAQGEFACIELPCQTPYLARCGMVLNNSSWQKISDQCPITRLDRHGVAVAQMEMSVRVGDAAREATCRR
jgi:hypothetical protein